VKESIPGADRKKQGRKEKKRRIAYLGKDFFQKRKFSRTFLFLFLGFFLGFFFFSSFENQSFQFLTTLVFKATTEVFFTTFLILLLHRGTEAEEETGSWFRCELGSESISCLRRIFIWFLCWLGIFFDFFFLHSESSVFTLFLLLFTSSCSLLYISSSSSFSCCFSSWIFYSSSPGSLTPWNPFCTSVFLLLLPLLVLRFIWWSCQKWIHSLLLGLSLWEHLLCSWDAEGFQGQGEARKEDRSRGAAGEIQEWCREDKEWNQEGIRNQWSVLFLLLLFPILFLFLFSSFSLSSPLEKNFSFSLLFLNIRFPCVHPTKAHQGAVPLLRWWQARPHHR